VAQLGGEITMIPHVSIIGLGKLGASIAVALASRGIHIIGVDNDPEALRSMAKGEFSFHEPSLAELFQASSRHISVSASYDEAILGSEITFIVVPTPSNAQGAFSLVHVEKAFHVVGRALKAKSTWHTVVLMSTVLPGSLRMRLIPILEQYLGSLEDRQVGVCYNPQFVALGSVVADFLHPDLILIGEPTKQAGERLRHFYEAVFETFPAVFRMSLESAELTKLALNSFITMKISFANLLAQVCEHIPHGDVDQVTRALGSDHRIGPHYLVGGLGYGGPCFPRDNRALGYLLNTLGIPFSPLAAVDAFNRAIPAQVFHALEPLLRRCKTVAVLGFTYKPGTRVVEASQALELIAAMVNHGIRVAAYDPLGSKEAAAQFPRAADFFESAEACLEKAPVVIIGTPDPAFLDIPAEAFHGKTVIDLWRLFSDRFKAADAVRYVPFGTNSGGSADVPAFHSMWEKWDNE
jgi:UDPglucose 6-dehydrogenase